MLLPGCVDDCESAGSSDRAVWLLVAHGTHCPLPLGAPPSRIRWGAAASLLGGGGRVAAFTAFRPALPAIAAAAAAVAAAAAAAVTDTASLPLLPSELYLSLEPRVDTNGAEDAVSFVLLPLPDEAPGLGPGDALSTRCRVWWWLPPLLCGRWYGGESK